MPLDTVTLCKYRLDRAKEDLLAAENNHQSGFYKAAINRSYYAIFHSIIIDVLPDDEETQNG